ncbi:WD domain G-beta repeat domain-containing protein [Phytophthora infestans]|uniref:WD domain G-beta repeat domain-containing protein n=1 Tax=Phytophthora infestans TaxID=4787 RepID=A0A8S9V555_PHYIN|nr:WD domain G-beta repeat domain-containing protein [Phytophthora infestans]
MSRSVSRHFVTEKVRALCVVSDVLYASETLQEEYEVLPLVATGGWDNETNHVSLHLPVRPTRDEHELRKEFGRGEDDVRPCELNTLAEEEHAGDANALQFVATRGENLLISASSAGGVFAFRVSSSAGDDEAAMTDGDSAKPLTAFTVQQWEQVFAGTAATCLEVSENRTSIVTASAGGALAWLKLDDTVSVEKIEIKDTSRLPINAVKFMGRDTVVATVGSLPGSQLRVWDLAANNKFPIATCVDTVSKSILTTLETHPTRPEMLITGGDDGSVRFWDRRKLDAPFRTEGYHHRAVRALKLHSASPRNLFTGGDDAVVNCWDFHHGRSPRDPVEYDHCSESTGNQNSTPFGSSSSGFSIGQGGLQVQPIVSGSQPWNALAIHAESDTLVAGSDAQSVVIIQHVSK